MKQVTGKTKTKPGGAYWYWTTLGPENVELTDKSANLPPGKYDLYWDFRGPPGAVLEFAIMGQHGELVAVSDSVPSNDIDGWGMKSFSVPEN